MISEIEEPTPSASVSKQTTNALAESPNANIKSPTEQTKISFIGRRQQEMFAGLLVNDSKVHS